MKRILYTIFCLLLLSSCDSFLKEYSQDLSRVNNFTDLDELLVGSAFLSPGLVSLSSNSIQISNDNYILVHFMSDELEENLLPKENPDNISYRDKMFPYFTWQQNVYLNYKKQDANEDTENWFWKLSYQQIANCNMILADADKRVPGKDEEPLALRVRGEAHFLRALYYYMLVNFYGAPYSPSTASSTPAVPINLAEYVVDKEFQRNTVAEVYKQIISDLDIAEKDLKDIHKPVSIKRVGINAVYLFRSRIALYMQDWETAKHYALLSLKENSNLQQMVGMDKETFPLSDNNVENIFSMGGTTLGNIIYSRPGQVNMDGKQYSPIWKISDRLYNLYEDGDVRKSTYFSNEYGEGNALYYHKINISVEHLGTYSDCSDQFLFRSAEAYLNVAEACAHLGETQEAIGYLTTLRSTRIPKAQPVNLSGKQLVTFIRQERERELCLEGQRWFDMRRYAVDAQYPEVSTVEHTYTVYKMVNGAYLPQSTSYYDLKTDDGGMTLDIPKKVRDFQNSIGNNERPLRNPVKEIDYNN